MKITILIMVCLGGNLARAGTEIVDFSAYHYREYPRLKVQGPWEFYPSVLLEPGDRLPEEVYNLGPGQPWNNLQLSDGRKMGAFGYGTYRLRIKGLRSAPQGYVLTTAASSAAKAIIYVEGFPEETRFLEVGRVGSGEDELPSKRDIRLRFYPRFDRTYTILLQVSNFTQYNGGARWDMVLAENDFGFLSRSIDGAINLLCIGIMNGLGIFSLMMWLRRRSEVASLYLALASFTVMVRTLGTNAFIVDLFPDSFYRFLRNCEYLGMSGGGAAYIMYLKVTFYPDLKSRFLSVLVGIGILLSIGCFVLPHYYLTGALPLFQFFIALTGATWVVLLLFAVSRHMEGSVMVFIGSCLILLAALSDIILVSHLSIFPFFTTPLAVATFLGIQSQAVAIRAARNFTLAQKFAEEREEAQEALRLEVESKLSMSSDLAHRLNNPLNYVLNGTALLNSQLQQMKLFIDAVFAGSESHPEARELKREFEEILSNSQATLQVMDEGVRRSNEVVDEIRALSGVDGVAMNRTCFGSVVTASLDRLTTNLGTQHQKRFHWSDQEAQQEFFASYPILVVSMEQILRYVAVRSEGPVFVSWFDRTQVFDGSLIIVQQLETNLRHESELWLNLEERLNHILKPCSVQMWSERTGHGLKIHWKVPVSAVSHPSPRGAA